MSHGLAQVFSVSVASGVTLASAVDLGRAFRRVYLGIPSKASSNIEIQGSGDGSTFRVISREQFNTATVHGNFSIDSSVTSRMVPIPPGFRYYKVNPSSGMTDTTTTFQIICSD